MTAPIPFTLGKADKPLILVDTTVNKKGPFRFVLDTGAGITVLTPGLANTLGVTVERTEKGLGAGGSVDVGFARVGSLAVGPATADGLDVGVIDLTQLSQAIETDLDGILGYSFLARYRVVIDYPNGTLELLPPAPKK